MYQPFFSPLGIALAAGIAAAICTTLFWMLHPPSNRTVRIAESAAFNAKHITRNVLVVFSADIKSEVLMALAVKMAKGQHIDVLAIYVIEVPMTLPIAAVLPKEEREALEVLTAAKEIGRKAGLEVHTRTIRDRQAGPAIIRAASDEHARLIVMGTYRENRYAGAPLARAIEYVTTHTQFDVLIGVASTADTGSMFALGSVEALPRRGVQRK
ncbi:MAG TPA: universal stress protein [Candidatus Eremiobacteraceae bacterium]